MASMLNIIPREAMGNPPVRKIYSNPYSLCPEPQKQRASTT